jgi:acyl carrier protein
MTREAKIRRIIADLSKCPIDADGNADLYNDLGLASVHALMLLTALEQQLDIHIPDDSFIQARTINQLVALAESLDGVAPQYV